MLLSTHASCQRVCVHLTRCPSTADMSSQLSYFMQFCQSVSAWLLSFPTPYMKPLSWLPPRKVHRSAWAYVGGRKAQAIIFFWKRRWSCWPVLCKRGTVNFTVSMVAARLCLRVWLGPCQNLLCTNAPDGAHECSCSFLLMKCLWRPNMNGLIHDDWCHKLIFLQVTLNKWQTFSLYCEWQEMKWLCVFSLR